MTLQKSRHIPWITTAEIDLKAVSHNLKQVIRQAEKNKFFLPTRPRTRNMIKAPETILAVIKADAYGHGMCSVAQLLDKHGVGMFGVSDVQEGTALRRAGIKKPILLFESALPSFAPEIVRQQLTPTVCTMDLAKSLNARARSKKKRLDIHVKVDTGMGRLGVWHEQGFEFIQKINSLTHLRIMGIFTHFPAADTDRKFTLRQLNHLYDLVTRLDKTGLIIPYIHAANSMGLAGYKTRILNLYRPGLMLYGLYPHVSLRKKIPLKPVMSVRSRVIFVKTIKKGQSISYGRTFFTKRDMMVATVPIGYNDGYFRALSNKADVLIGGTRCPVIGRVTMDQIMVDVTRVKTVKPGTMVTILGRQNHVSVSADELAKMAGTINYEIICAFGNRMPRVYK